MSVPPSKFNEFLHKTEQAMSRGCPVDINEPTFEYFKTMMVVPAIFSVLLGILWLFIPASWVWYFVVILLITVMHAVGFDSPAAWRILQADFPKAKYLYELAKWKQHNPFKFMELMEAHEIRRRLPHDYSGRRLIAHGDMMLESAKLGYPEALLEVGLMKDAGQYAGVESSAFEMILWAAQKGSVNAQAEIGSWYLNGHRTEKNTVEALRWLQQAVESGNHSAECDLGEMYFHGNGVEQNKPKGVDLLKKSADGGVIHAKQKAGMIIYTTAKNRGDQLIGLKYILDAANAGHIQAKIFIALLAITTEMKMSPLEGYASLLYLSRTSESALKALSDVQHRFTEEEKAEAQIMVEELIKALASRE